MKNMAQNGTIFLTARVTFTVEPRILWDFSVSVNGTLEKFLHRGQ